MIRCAYLHGEEHGVYQEWYPTCQLMVQSSYVHGKEQSIYQEWFDNGNLSILAYY